MIAVLVVICVLFIVHLVAAIVATRLIAGRIEEQNPPGGVFVPVSGGQLHLYDMAPPVPSGEPPVLLLHGATSNARDMVLALGAELSRRRRVIAVDRPGHGWSGRPRGRADASPARQAALIAEALRRLGVGKVVVVGYSMAGSVAASFALDLPEQTAGLVLLAPVTHPWPGGVTWYYDVAAMPVLGSLFVGTVMTPVAAWRLQASIDASFLPLAAPQDYGAKTAAALVLRPAEFRWNGQDLADLLPFVTRQATRYGAIRVPTAILASDDDTVVSTPIHAMAIAGQIEGAALTVLRGKGHMIHYNARDAVLAEIERICAAAAPRPQAEEATG